MKIINVVEYVKTEEGENLLTLLRDYLENKNTELKNNSYKFNVYEWHFDQDEAQKLREFNVPFFDLVMQFYLQDKDKVFLHIPSFHKQLNLFMKCLFLRIFWFTKDKNPDKFAEFIWKNYISSTNKKFFELKNIAEEMFNDLDSVKDFYQNFILNESYELITLKETNILFDDLCNDFFRYKRYNEELVQCPTSFLQAFKAGEELTETTNPNSKDHQMANFKFYANEYNKLLSGKSYYKFVPLDKGNALKHFKGYFLFSKGIFIPQILVFSP